MLRIHYFFSYDTFIHAHYLRKFGERECVSLGVRRIFIHQGEYYEEIR